MIEYITDGQVEFFQENGYIQIDDVLSPDEVSRFAQFG